MGIVTDQREGQLNKIIALRTIASFNRTDVVPKLEAILLQPYNMVSGNVAECLMTLAPKQANEYLWDVLSKDDQGWGKVQVSARFYITRSLKVHAKQQSLIALRLLLRAKKSRNLYFGYVTWNTLTRLQRFADKFYNVHF